MTKLSEHFTQAEFEASDTAVRFHLDNRMGDDEIANACRLCELIAERIRAEFGAVHINSGFRALKVNRAVGSKDSSQHVTGQAMDLTVKTATPLEVCQWIVQQNLPFDQVIHEYGRWCHVSVAPKGFNPRRQSLTIDRTGTRQGLHPVTT